MIPPSFRRSHRAVSLVDVLVAVTILSIALLVYVTAAQSSRALTDKGDATTRAAATADDMINTLNAQDYSDLSLGTTTYTVSNLRQGVMTVVIGYLDGSSANTNILQATVTVTWGAYSSATPQSAGNLTRSTLIVNF
jgi:hypothetical protein